MADTLKNSIRKIHLACAAGVVVAIGAGAALGVYPMIKSGKASIAQAEELRSQLQQLDGVSLKTAELQSKISSIQSEIDQQEKRLPTKGQMDQFLNELATVAKDAGVSVEQFNKGDVESTGDYKVLPAQIVANGSYSQCYKFLAGLRKMERLTRLENASIVTEQKTGEGSKPGEKGDCQLRVSIATFMAK